MSLAEPNLSSPGQIISLHSEEFSDRVALDQPILTVRVALGIFFNLQPDEDSVLDLH